jgi:hypothetical protein
MFVLVRAIHPCFASCHSVCIQLGLLGTLGDRSPPLSVPGSSPPPTPQFASLPLPTSFTHHLQIEYRRFHRHRSMFGLACPTGTPRAYQALALPNSSVRLSPASYRLHPPSSGRIPQVPPTSSPLGSMFGLARPTGTCAYWALALLNSSFCPSPTFYKLHSLYSCRIP